MDNGRRFPDQLSSLVRETAAEDEIPVADAEGFFHPEAAPAGGSGLTQPQVLARGLGA